MDTTTSTKRASEVLRELGVAELSRNWSGCDAVWPILERMSDEGAIVLIKIDGQRTDSKDTGRYTILVSGGPLGEDFFRVDTPILEDGLAKAILFYAERCWRK